MRNISRTSVRFAAMVAISVACLAAVAAPAQARPIPTGDSSSRYYGPSLVAQQTKVGFSLSFTPCNWQLTPGSCYSRPTGIPATPLQTVAAAPTACPIWYWDGAIFRPRAVQSGCVTTNGGFDYSNYPNRQFYPRLFLTDVRQNSQGTYRRLISRVFLVGDDRILAPYAADANTWIKIGDPGMKYLP
jgi:hypothetical protein